MIRRRWLDRILSGQTAFTFQIAQAFMFVLLAIATITNFGAAQISLVLVAISWL